MKRLVRVEDRQITIPPHKHAVYNARALSPTGAIETAFTPTYVMIPDYKELTWRERRKRKKNPPREGMRNEMRL